MNDNQFSIPLAPQEYAVKSAALAAKGIAIEGPQGTVSAHGVTIMYDYDGQNLKGTVMSHPVWVTTSHCVKLLTEWITAA